MIHSTGPAESPPLVINILPELPPFRSLAPVEGAGEEAFVDHEDVRKGLIEHIGSALRIEGSIELPLAIIVPEEAPEGLTVTGHFSGALFTVDVDDHAHLMLRMVVRRDSLDTGIEDVSVSHLQKFGDFVILGARNESELVVAVPDGHGVRVELVILLPFKLNLKARFEFIESYRSVPISEAGDVKVQKMTVL